MRFYLSSSFHQVCSWIEAQIRDKWSHYKWAAVSHNPAGQCRPFWLVTNKINNSYVTLVQWIFWLVKHSWKQYFSTLSIKKHNSHAAPGDQSPGRAIPNIMLLGCKENHATWFCDLPTPMVIKPGSCTSKHNTRTVGNYWLKNNTWVVFVHVCLPVYTILDATNACLFRTSSSCKQCTSSYERML